MNEKYEIIIKEDGKEIKRERAKGFVFTAVSEEGIYKLAMANGISVSELALMTNANEELIDEIWKTCGVEIRELQKILVKRRKR